MNSIDLVSDEDEEVFAPRVDDDEVPRKRRMCVVCGLVEKSHVCPQRAKIMRMPSKVRTSEPAVAEDLPGSEAAASSGTNAFGFLQKLLTEHSQLQSDAQKMEAQRESLYSALNSAASSEAATKAENAKLKAELEDKVKQLKKRESKKPVVAAAAGHKQSPTVEVVGIVNECIKFYVKKTDDAKKNHPPLPPVPPPAPVQVVMIVQTNQSVNTERTLWFAMPDWYYDSSDPPLPHNPRYTKITDPSVCKELLKLGHATYDASGKCTSFTPTVGSSITYSVNHHNYKVSVVHQAKPTAPVRSQPEVWQEQVLFKGKFFKFSNADIDRLLATVDFDMPDTIVRKSQEVANLATVISAAGSKFTYDVSQCELWVKPLWLKVWLTAAKTRKFNEARLLMHGMKAQEYDKLAGDMCGFDMNFAQEGACYYGFYASVSDHVASYYNRYKAIQDKTGQYKLKYPDGSFILGLLWIKPSVQKGAYENYTLGLNNLYPAGRPTPKLDAYAIRDQLLWLPIGFAVACPRAD